MGKSFGQPDQHIRHHLNEGTLWSLPDWSKAPRTQEKAFDFAKILDAGFTGMQVYAPNSAAADAGLKMSGMARIVDPSLCDRIIAQHRAWGFEATTVHLGTGLESDAESHLLISSMLEAATRHGHPVFIETHRSTITQDPVRTLNLVEAFPEIRFNADLSHWYTGLEMRYGDFEAKVARLQPIFDRVRYLHLRMGHSCEMQTPLFHLRNHQAWQDFSFLWKKCIEGFRATAKNGERLISAPELLPASVAHQGQVYQMNYARLKSPEDPSTELSDRWLEALELRQLVNDIWKSSVREKKANNDDAT